MTSLGKWTLLDVVGRGAAGTAWRATDFERTVTIKIADASDLKARQSLEREQRIISRLRHPNLPHLIESFDDPPALVFDTPPARTYGDLLSRGELWAVPLRRRLDALSVTAEVLDYLHREGIIHRDVKPAHLTMAEPPMLFDFGIAQMGNDPDAPELNAGTAPYLPPIGEQVSPARDAYAFAVTAYELMFGAHPALTASDRDISAAVLRQRAADKVRAGLWRLPTRIPRLELPPDLRGADLDGLNVLFSTGLGKPDKRPSSLAMWMDHLRACVPLDDGVTAAPEILPEAFAPAHTMHEVAAALQTDSGNQRRTWLTTGLVFALIILIICASVALSLRP